MDRENLEKIMNSNKLTMSEKMEAIKDEMKILLRKYSYLELFKKLKESKLSKKSKDIYLNLYEKALEELLEEKKKELTLEEADKLLDYLQAETNKTIKFIKETNESLLSEDDVKEKSKEATAADLNYKRLAVAAKEGTLTETEKVLFENEAKKIQLRDAKSDLDLLSEYEADISKHYSAEVKKNTK